MHILCLLLCADLRAFRQEQLASSGAVQVTIKHLAAIDMTGVSVHVIPVSHLRCATVAGNERFL
jgi:hypothetical protein